MWCEWWQPTDLTLYRGRRSKEVHVLADSINEAKFLLRCHIDVDSDNDKCDHVIIWEESPDRYSEFPCPFIDDDFGKEHKITVIFSETDWLFIRKKL